MAAGVENERGACLGEIVATGVENEREAYPGEIVMAAGVEIEREACLGEIVTLLLVGVLGRCGALLELM